MMRLANMSLIPKLPFLEILSAMYVLRQNKLASSQGRGGEKLGTFKINSFRFVRDEWCVEKRW
jgi:hypothetical protein